LPKTYLRVKNKHTGDEFVTRDRRTGDRRANTDRRRMTRRLSDRDPNDPDAHSRKYIRITEAPSGSYRGAPIWVGDIPRDRYNELVEPDFGVFHQGRGVKELYRGPERRTPIPPPRYPYSPKARYLERRSPENRRKAERRKPDNYDITPASWRELIKSKLKHRKKPKPT
jgi:hypothetical protein